MSASEAAKRSVQKLADAMFAAWNAHDGHAYAAPFAADGEFTNLFGMQRKGRQVIAEWHEVLLKSTMFKDSALRATGSSIRFLRPDVASVDVRWEMTGARDAQGRDVPLRYGLVNFIATEENGVWSIAVFHNAELPPPERIKAFAALVK